MDFSDQALVSEIRSGSSVAFERLMRRYERLVYKIAYGFTRDATSAMDVTQETFLKVYARLESWRGEGMNWKRALRRHPTHELDEAIFLQPDPQQEDPLIEREVHDALHRSLSSLNPRQQLALVLRYFQGMSTREIAGTLECSEGTARNILFRGLSKLRSVMTEYEETEP